ncbi:SRPBCC domain-containing protein [Sphingomonas canadensis]|uniref:SRPBCC domain-containing protein n=1 Tax=Sphingomonas canadensis TaxID=1219257 RepID=A0ABW3H6N9_9SPHN|nr:SRPBCC domain-containing protein [Sphingomonas canadensis]MCW3836300.1 SRPBCC domain-containing protein [Sphingomonas canadensis]
MIRTALLAAAIAALAPAAPAAAEVTASSDTAFTVEYRIALAASPAKVWETITLPGAWWEGEHTYSGSSANMTLDPRAGGCWCEKTKDDGSVEHMRVLYAQPLAMLRLQGGLGPLQAMPVTGVLSYELKPAGEGTELTIVYSVSGAGGGLAGLATVVDEVLALQWTRLKEAAEAP